MERPSAAPPLNSLPVVLQGLDPSSWPANHEDLFKCNSDWSLVNQTLAVLSEQMEKCERDLQALLAFREEALEDPEAFMQRQARFPSSQVIEKVAWVNPLSWASGMRTRRSGSSTRHGQNQEILVKRLDELQSKNAFLYTGNAGPLLCSSLPPTPPNASNTPNSGGGTKRTLSKSASTSALESAPKKRAAGSRSANATPVSASHNVAWGEEEKAKLNLLLAQYPEESAPSRRWAKIAAALGSRTPSQVATRVAKQKAKRERILSSSNTTTSTTSTELMDTTRPEYKEYQKLQAALDKFAKGEPVQVHAGYECDGCRAEPIVGLRHACSCGKYDLCDSCFQSGKHLSTSHRSHTLHPNAN